MVHTGDSRLLQENIPTSSAPHPASYSVVTGDVSLGIKWVAQKADHSPPCNAEIKNEWSYSTTHPTCLHVMYRDTRNFSLIEVTARASYCIKYGLSTMECYASLLCWYCAGDLTLHCHILDSSRAHTAWGFRSPGTWHCVIAWVAPDVSNDHVPLSSGQNQSMKNNQRWVFFMNWSAFLIKATQYFKRWEPLT